jgi:DNA-binding Lrp family transcriptional regulator
LNKSRIARGFCGVGGVMFDKKELTIMAHLRENARQKLTEISRKTGIPISTIYDKLQRKNSVILRHTSLINFEKLGYNTRASIVIKAAPKDRVALRTFMMKDHRINSLFRINNGYDFLAEGIFTSIKDAEDYFDTLEKKFSIEKRDAYFIVGDVKREAFMSDPATATLL